MIGESTELRDNALTTLTQTLMAPPAFNALLLLNVPLVKFIPESICVMQRHPQLEDCPVFDKEKLHNYVNMSCSKTNTILGSSQAQL